MFGIILQSSASVSTIRQTLLVPAPHDWTDNLVIFTRTVPNQRVQGERYRWAQGQADQSLETLVGLPVLLDFTDTDLDILQSTGVPTTFAQKADRRVVGQTSRTTVRLDTVLSNIQSLWVTSPDLARTYVGEVVEAIVSSQPAPAPVVTPVVTQPAPVVASTTASTTVTDGGVAPNALWIPDATDPEVAGYIHRENLGGTGVSDTAFALHAYTKQKNLAINGEAGTGKTSFARWLASYLNLPFVVLECSPQLDLDSVEGSYNQDGNGGWEWTYAPFAQALSQPSIILLNESSRMKPAQNAYFMSALNERKLAISKHRGEVIQRHPQCLIITDFNSGYNGTVSHDEAFLDRFAVQVTFDYDIEIEKQFIPSESLLELAKLVRDQRGDVFTHTPFSTRLLKNFVEQATDPALGLKGAVYVLLQSFIDPIERQALKTLLDSYLHNIASELGVA